VHPADYIAAATPFVLVAWLVVQLFTNGKLGEVKLLIEQGNGKVDSHIAADDEKHAAIDAHLEATDKMVVWLRDRTR
jgi:hypothetical protein